MVILFSSACHIQLYSYNLHVLESVQITNKSYSPLSTSLLYTYYFPGLRVLVVSLF